MSFFLPSRRGAVACADDEHFDAHYVLTTTEFEHGGPRADSEPTPKPKRRAA